MLKTSSRAILLGLLLYAVYLFGVSYFCQLNYKWPFLVIAAYYAFIYIMIHLDYSAEREGKTVTFKDKGAMVLDDDKFVTASIISIILFLIAVTIPLATIYLNQKGIYHVHWFFQIISAFVGLVFIYCTSIPYSSMSDVTHTMGYDPRKDATDIVISTMSEVLGIDESEITPSMRVIEDCGADDIDLIDITIALDKRTQKIYGSAVFSIIPRTGMNPKLKTVLDLCMAETYRRNGAKPTAKEIKDFYMKLNRHLYTIGDYIDFVAAGIVILRGRV